MSNRGIYRVKNRKKYMGTTDTKYNRSMNDPKYRSSWERRVCSMCDNNANVKRWGFENVIIPYMGGDGKPHRYIVDFYIEIMSSTNELLKFLVEVKPPNDGPIINESGDFVFTNAPKPPKRKTPKAVRNFMYKVGMYKKNMRKWNAVQQFCKKNNIMFKLMDDKIVF